MGTWIRLLCQDALQHPRRGTPFLACLSVAVADCACCCGDTVRAERGGAGAGRFKHAQTRQRAGATAAQPSNKRLGKEERGSVSHLHSHNRLAAESLLQPHVIWYDHIATRATQDASLTLQVCCKPVHEKYFAPLQPSSQDAQRQGQGFRSGQDHNTQGAFAQALQLFCTVWSTCNSREP